VVTWLEDGDVDGVRVIPFWKWALGGGIKTGLDINS
jgi:hypothetical protein